MSFDRINNYIAVHYFCYVCVCVWMKEIYCTERYFFTLVFFMKHDNVDRMLKINSTLSLLFFITLI